MKLFFIFFFFVTSNLCMATGMESYCQDLGGEIKGSYQCPRSKVPLPVKTCVYKNSDGEKLFFNGCSGPSGGHSKLFFPACVKHDLCYHHEPASHGLRQKDCDQALLQDLMKLCAQAPNEKKCTNWAKFMYRGLRVVGSIAFQCENSPRKY